mmetsp:Transcript_59954/g.104900  ORF Transcript_59954/g.104900 Transcript_59954/m.104900 type:complete len:223 (+) Transcript_59954:251-919(+)
MLTCSLWKSSALPSLSGWYFKQSSLNRLFTVGLSESWCTSRNLYAFSKAASFGMSKNHWVNLSVKLAPTMEPTTLPMTAPVTAPQAPAVEPIMKPAPPAAQPLPSEPIQSTTFFAARLPEILPCHQSCILPIASQESLTASSDTLPYIAYLLNLCLPNSDNSPPKLLTVSESLFFKLTVNAWRTFAVCSGGNLASTAVPVALNMVQTSCSPTWNPLESSATS